MPCYLFTYHAYGSWMPDRPQGYVRRGEGVLAPDEAMADHYRSNAKGGEVVFSTPHQRLIILGLLDASKHVECEIHGVATEPSHFHVLASWRGERSRMSVSNSLRGRIKRELNGTERRRWLARDASRRQVKSRSHFEHLMQFYLPKHSGLKWNQQEGIHE